MSENPYAAPRTKVSDTDKAVPDRPSVGARFLWTFAIGLPVFLVFILLLPRDQWLMGAIGSAIFAGFSGLIAMCIPVKSKAVFIVPSIMISVIAAYLLGTHSG
jgi:hypothetical protein